ncbi:long-chain fatty acid--CoA ligase [Algoriphagus kandeliae]|uniref:Long-chain fatty acid--CoA ligase n=1 Tax=Algoriphagus kandeliae TaxID=2562278 RepID=A0A4Y9QPH4_9BACT|nr:acyl-CoA synthetase [Algoriphagus kandeliae]TFV94534.1 long-chain fatty acid--CoA ligase [Algoriphagus kandeliae]
MIELIERASQFLPRTAVVDQGKRFSYRDLLDRSEQIAHTLLGNKSDLQSQRVAFIIPPSFDYLAIQWGIWRAGGIAVPLCTSYPFPSLQYVIEDTQASFLIVSPEFEDLLSPYRDSQSLAYLSTNDLENNSSSSLPDVNPDRGAMILYTSGTTSLPKGVLSTHSTITAQIKSLVEAWHWSENDHILSILPLHHVHGIINVNSCALWSGATVQFLPNFDAARVFEIFCEGEVNVFMAVPTIYFKLIAYYETLPESKQDEIRNALKKFRFMVSGSAALPVSVMEKWKSISGHTLLERYGMTEIGMAISNPYEGERRPGHIGQPLPGVSIRLCDENGQEVPVGQAGEIQVKGENVFSEYWEKPEATAKAFTADGWFKTGDIALVEDGYFRILGRDSVDIIKSGGYKISALEIEEKIRTHEAVKDCGVVGIPDEEWGEKVVAAIVPNQEIEIQALKTWLKTELPSYKIPKEFLFLEELPRNALGKVTKNELKKLF